VAKVGVAISHVTPSTLAAISLGEGRIWVDARQALSTPMFDLASPPSDTFR
jgi:hypothetical protein